MLLSNDQILSCLKIPNNSLSTSQRLIILSIIQTYRDDPEFESIPTKVKTAIRNHPELTSLQMLV